MTDKDDKQDTAGRLIGGLAALGAGFVARRLIEYGWRKITGKKPPANPESPEIGLGEAIGYAVVMGIGMEVARILATRAAARKWAAWKRTAQDAEADL